MKKYEVWMEGFRIQGNDGIATYEGTYEANSFKEAVEVWVNLSEDRKRQYDPERLTYWGCKFYDNETDARKNFG